VENAEKITAVNYTSSSCRVLINLEAYFASVLSYSPQNIYNFALKVITTSKEIFNQD
jgi:hypothetical protein